MKKTVLSSATVLLIALVTFGCSKQPTANFTTDKTEYTQGETVICTNLSTDGESFTWTLPSGQISNSKDLNFSTSTSMSPGTYNMTLQVFSKNEKKSATLTKSFVLKQASASLVVYTSLSNVSPITVKIDGITTGTISLYYKNVIPSCGASGCVTTTLSLGRHTISATDGSKTWSASTDVLKGICNSFELK